ncbi:MAG: lanthionine synthetase C family protein [Burkholderiales bacterium]|nr:lanthionine synthetase C family protein [Burkholderiales bacterium]
MTARPAWRPILEGAQRIRAAEILEGLALDVARFVQAPQEFADLHQAGNAAALASGDAGLALFLAGLTRYENAPLDAAALRDTLLKRATDALAARAMDASLFNGFTGIAWTVQRFLPAARSPGRDPLASIDDVLAEYLLQRGCRQVDLISGIVGIGVYLLERLPSPAAKAGLQSIVAMLDSRAETDGAGGTAWRVPAEQLDEVDRVQYPQGRFDLGVAHGVPGIMAFLARVAATGIERERSSALVAGSVAWLMRQERVGSESAAFPYWVAPVGPTRSTELAWCYGDLGIALAMMTAATAAGRRDWRDHAVRIGLAAAIRSMHASSKVDAGLCHGSCGIAHLFNRMYQATGDSAFLDAARNGYGNVFAMHRKGRGIGGFLSLIRDSNLQDLWITTPELLNGAAGIGLGLLAGMLPDEPSWDRILLISPLRPG